MGSAIRLLDARGNTMEASAYDPFGKETASFIKDRDILTVTDRTLRSPFGFAGYERTGKKMCTGP